MDVPVHLVDVARLVTVLLGVDMPLCGLPQMGGVVLMSLPVSYYLLKWHQWAPALRRNPVPRSPKQKKDEVRAMGSLQEETRMREFEGVLKSKHAGHPVTEVYSPPRVNEIASR